MAKLAKLLQAAAGAAAGGAGLNVEEVFSTYLYTGNASTQAINNGIDLSGEGGLLWIKKRSGTASNFLFGSDRSADNTALLSNTTLAYYGTSYSVSHSSTGFTVPATTSGDVNESGHDYASWTFRKAPKFFDVVTYTGTGTDQTINHNLGTTVGFIVVKRTDTTGNWPTWHHDLGDDHRMYLNGTAESVAQTQRIRTATTTTFTVGTATEVNASGGTYVAYLFAHNDGDGDFGPDGDADIIKCGTWTGTGSVMDINLGFEPQWIMYKRTDATGDWEVFDNMRGLVVGGSSNSTGQRLIPNRNEAEGTTSPLPVVPTPTGFRNESSFHYTSGRKFIYIAIRRGPMAVPESATDVFAMDTLGGTSPTPPGFNSGFPVDMAFLKPKSSSSDWLLASRLIQGKQLVTNSTAAEVNETANVFDYMNGYYDFPYSDSNYQAWMWKRAPSFFDVVCYTGTGNLMTLNHNLGVTPEMIWTKRRNSTASWLVYHSATGLNKYLLLNSTAAVASAGNYSAVSDTTFAAPFVNSGGTFISYLFASLDGVSKVGSYTGNGTSQTIDCGFSSGARFVLIKATSVAYGWMLFDTERGITSGNDSLLLLNDTDAETTAFDSVDPYSSGFTAVQGPYNVNQNGVSYIFYAIA